MGMNSGMVQDARELTGTMVKSTVASTEKPYRWVPVVLAVAGIGTLLAIGAPLLRFRPVRKVAKTGASKLLWHLARG